MERPPARWLELVDLLVDGPSSFAGLYSAANRLLPRASSERFSVDELWEAVTSMEASGWIKVQSMLPTGTWAEPTVRNREEALRRYRVWLPHAAYDEMSVDEVGVWLELQPKGRSEWAKWSEAADASHKWTLDQSAETSTITVHASTAEDAEQALAEWLEQHPDIEIVSDTGVEPSAGFRLRDGAFVAGGICLRVAYRETRKQSD